MNHLLRLVDSAVAHLLVGVLLSCTALVVHGAKLCRRIFHLRGPQRETGQLRLLVTGTFYNENWFRSHILPLAETRSLATIYVIADRPMFDVDKVTYACPPSWCRRILGRTIPRGLMVLWVALWHRPDLLMGYHIMPNAIFCLLASSIVGGRSVYQMTGGPIQIVGGGVASENALLCRLRRHSVLLERLIFGVVRLFDVVVVRGRRAAGFVESHRLSRRTLIISGSVDTERFQPNGRPKRYDLVLVARHIKEKQPHLFLDIVHRLRRTHPELRTALVGDGPLTAELQERSRRLDIEQAVAFLGNVEKVDEILAASKVFVLTSQTEGLSIAMVEAMASGLPVFAPDIGELGELHKDGETGFVIRPEDISATAHQIGALLNDEARLARMSAAAREQAVTRNGVVAVAQRWDEYLVCESERRS